MDPISLLIYFVVGILVLAGVYYLCQYLGLPQPLSNIILIVAALLVLLILLRGGSFNIGAVWLVRLL